MAKGILTQLDTMLGFTLIPICGGTTLVLEHSGFRSLKPLVVSFVLGMGWKKKMKKLNLLLEKMEREEPLNKHKQSVVQGGYRG